MTTIINADDGIVSGVAGLKYSADNSGALVLQTNGTTAISISAAQVVTFTNAVNFATASFTTLTSTGASSFATSSGNVGIGTASPICKLDVTGRARFVQDVAPTTGAIQLLQNSGDTSGAYIQWANNGASVEKGWLTVDTSSNMLFATVSTERMRIDSSGNVGISNASPAYKLDVVGVAKGSTVQASGTPAGSFSANAWFVQNEGASTNRVYYTGANSSTYGILQEYSALSSGGPSITRYADNVTQIFYTNAAERMRIDSSGNVGIATNSPTDSLTIGPNTTSNYQIRVNGAVTPAYFGAYQSQAYFGVNRRTSDGAIINASYGAAYIAQVADTSGSYITFTTAAAVNTQPSERMRITGSGLVGIGTTTPASTLDVNGFVQAIHSNSGGYAYRVVANSGNTSGQIQWTNNGLSSDWGYLGATAANQLIWRTAIGDPNYPSNTQMSINGGVVNMRKVAAGGGDIGDWPNPVLGMQNYDSNFHGITMLIMGGKNDDTTYQTGSGVWNWRLWDTGGAAGWTTSSASTMCSLSGPGTLTMTSSSNGVQLTAGATAWAAYSDERMKDIIEPITDALDKVSTLRTVIGKYKTDAEGVRKPMLIAQDVQAVLPEAVTETAYLPNQNDLTKPSIVEQRLTLAYTEVIPLLTAAINELNAKVTALEAQLAAK